MEDQRLSISQAFNLFDNHVFIGQHISDDI